METWKEVKGYEQYYMVSNLGRVKGLERKIKCSYGVRTKKEKILKPDINNKGRAYVYLTVNRVKKKVFVHRLVLSTFNPIEDWERYEVNHKDENPLNNSLDNLEWCTHKENINYGTRNQRHAEKMSHGHILQIKDNQVIKDWASLKAIRRGFSTNYSAILQCCNGQRENYKGYQWKYAEVIA